MTFNQQIDTISDSVTYRRNTFHRAVKLGIGQRQIRLSERIPFQCRHPALHRRFCLGTELLRGFRAGEPAVDVDAHLVVRPSAEQLIDGYTKRLAENVPQCHFHRRQRTHQNRTAAPVRIAVDIMEVAFNVERIFADKVFLDMLNRAEQSGFLIFECCFTDAVEALVGIDLDKDPVGAETIHNKGFYVCHFHCHMLLYGSLISQKNSGTILFSSGKSAPFSESNRPQCSGTAYFAPMADANRAASVMFMLLPTPLTGRNTASMCSGRYGKIFLLYSVSPVM